jgi:hypothetical protein
MDQEKKASSFDPDNPVAGQYIEIIAYNTRSKTQEYIGTVDQDGLEKIREFQAR